MAITDHVLQDLKGTESFTQENLNQIDLRHISETRPSAPYFGSE